MKNNKISNVRVDIQIVSLKETSYFDYFCRIFAGHSAYHRGGIHYRPSSILIKKNINMMATLNSAKYTRIGTVLNSRVGHSAEARSG